MTSSASTPPPFPPMATSGDPVLKPLAAVAKLRDLDVTRPGGPGELIEITKDQSL